MQEVTKARAQLEEKDSALKLALSQHEQKLAEKVAELDRVIAEDKTLKESLFEKSEKINELVKRNAELTKLCSEMMEELDEKKEG